MIPIKKVKAGPEVMGLQDAIHDVLRPIVSVPFLDGYRLDATLSNGTNVIQHSLGRTPAGYILIEQTASGSFYLSAKDSKTITVTCASSGAVPISIWVF